MKINLIFLLLILWILDCMGQVKLIPEKPFNLDDLKGGIPFDVPLKFKKEYAGNISVLYIGVIGLDNEGCPVKQKLSDDEYAIGIKYYKSIYPGISKKQLEEKFPRIVAKSDSARHITRTFKDNKTTVEFTLNPLKPNTKYAITIVAKPTKDRIQDVLKLRTLENRHKDRLTYYQKHNYAANKDGKEDLCSLKQIPFPFSEFIDSIKPKLIDFTNFYNSALKAAGDTTAICKPLNVKLTNDLVKKLIECKSCKDSYAFLLAPDSLQLMLNSIKNLTSKDTFNNNLKGLFPLNAYTLEEVIPSENYIDRIETFNSTLKSFNQIVKAVRIIKSVEPSNELEELYIELVELNKCINVYKRAFDKIQSEFENLEKNVFKKPEFSTISFVKTETNIYNFETRSQYSFTGDFGLIYYGPKLNNSFAPYLGCHINFRYVDKDIPWRLYPNKTWAHKLSFHLGTTLISLKEEGRTDNFFKNSGLMTGFGFRFGHVVRADGGILWFNRLDENPLIDNKQISATPYFGLSFDLSVRNFMNGFNTFFN